MKIKLDDGSMAVLFGILCPLLVALIVFTLKMFLSSPVHGLEWSDYMIKAQAKDEVKNKFGNNSLENRTTEYSILTTRTQDLNDKQFLNDKNPNVKKLRTSTLIQERDGSRGGVVRRVETEEFLKEEDEYPEFKVKNSTP